MDDERLAVELDEEILEAALTILDGGTRPRLPDLAARFPGREVEVEAVLDALNDYQRRVGAEREVTGVAPADGVLVPGTELGDFTVEGWLGGGGMGGVYRARQRSEGDRMVALKVLSPAVAEKDPRALARFHRESRLAAEVRHESFAEVFTTGTERGFSFIAMRLIEGRTLHDVLLSLVRRRQLGEPLQESRDYVRRVVRLVREVAGSLAAIHAMGLVHRDVKPSNIILEGASEGDDFGALGKRPVLVDYGLLRQIEASEVTGDQTVLGTVAFVSPEAWLGREVDARSDVFSLGAVLHDLLSLTRPGKRRLAISGLSDVTVLNPVVDRRLAAIVAMAIDDRTSVRYHDGAAFAADLDRYLQGKPIAALPMNPIKRLILRYRRNPLQTATAVLVGLLIGLLLAGAGYLGNVAKVHYDAAAEAKRLEMLGAVPDAEAIYRVLLEARLSELLPGLGDDLARARAFEEDEAFATLCRSLRGAEDEGLVEAHVALQRFLLTPGNERWHPTWMRFLKHELRPENALSRRRRAAETIAFFLVIHPCTYPAAPDAALGIHELEPVLIEIATASGPRTVDPELRRLAASALSGMSSDAALEALIALMGVEDAELSRVARHAAMRIWHQVYEDDGLLELPETLLGAWHRAVNELSSPERRGLSTRMLEGLESLVYSLAWTRLEFEAAGRAITPSGSPLQIDPWLSAIEDALSVFREGRPVPIVPEFGHGYTRLGHRDAAYRQQTCENWFGTTESPYRYLNIWNRQGESLSGELDLLSAELPDETWIDKTGKPWTTVAARVAFSDSGHEPILEGRAVRAGWQGAEPLSDGPLEQLRYFQLDRPGQSALGFVAAVPPAAESARIHIDHHYAMRYFLPWGGGARIRVSVGAEGPVHLLDVPRERSRVTFFVDDYILAEDEELEVLVELVSATSTYRINGVEVEFQWREK